MGKANRQILRRTGYEQKKKFQKQLTVKKSLASNSKYSLVIDNAIFKLSEAHSSNDGIFL